ncbi:polycomb group protein EMF2B isoform X3 [Lolium perenne]|uniref:polycomb group protein EMF2B isoform X3 n=1 Tax=Lolium perenne TaxID=4522 RepID=UPI003A9A5F59
MPGLALPNHHAVNNGCAFSYPRSADQMCGQQSRAQLSPDEELTLEECLALYRKPVELYNIIQLRAIKNPPSLQRCLSYKIDAKRKRRIQISVSISGSTNTELPAHGIFPLYVLFARATSNDPLDGNSPVYRFSRACLLTSFSESGDSDHSKATFSIPDLKSLATSQVSNHNIILISCGQLGQHLSENFSENHMEYSSRQKLGGQCTWGKIPIDLLCSDLDNCVTLSLGRTVQLTPQISMSPGFIEPTFLVDGSCLTFFSQKAYATGSYELRASIDAQEAGAKDMHLSPYSCYSYDDIPLSSLPHIIRLRTGNVLFNYKHCKKFLKSEVTEDFSCSFCLVQCGSFKGLEYHLTSSHELFHFEFWVSEDYQAVNVSLKIDTRRAELLTTAGDDRSKRVFFYRSRFKKRCRRLGTTIEKTKHVHPHIMEPGSPRKTVPVDKGTSVVQTSIDSHPALRCNNHLTPAVPLFGKTTKLSIDRADPRNGLLLEHQFFHSQKAQRMELEEVLADHDSEDEIDNDITDFEDMTRLDGFSNVTKDEKHIMHMWNSFVRRQRVLADGHIRWACDAFSRQHGQELVQNPALRWCWRLVMIKLWKHGLLDARTMNACNKFLDDLESESSCPKQT